MWNYKSYHSKFPKNNLSNDKFLNFKDDIKQEKEKEIEKEKKKQREIKKEIDKQLQKEKQMIKEKQKQVQKEIQLEKLKQKYPFNPAEVKFKVENDSKFTKKINDTVIGPNNEKNYSGKEKDNFSLINNFIEDDVVSEENNYNQEMISFNLTKSHDDTNKQLLNQLMLQNTKLFEILGKQTQYVKELKSENTALKENNLEFNIKLLKTPIGYKEA